MTSRRFFVFDFDGVLCDSTPECMVTAWNAWQRYSGTSRVRWSLGDFTRKEAAEFSRLRPRVRGAGEYFVVQKALAERVAVQSAEDYRALVELWKPEVTAFAEVFLNERNALRTRDPQAWLAMHVPHHRVIRFAAEAAVKDSFAIATLKDAHSVEVLLDSWGVDLSQRCILASDLISTKLEALDSIAESRLLSPREITFLDDNCGHLIGPQRAGYDVYQTTWGNVLPECITSSQALGIPCVRDVDLEEWS